MTSVAGALAAADYPGPEIVFWASRAGILILVLAGVLKCRQIARRPGANRKGVRSLECFLWFVVLSFVWGGFSHLYAPERVPFAISTALLVGCGVLLIGSVLLAVAGLREGRRHPGAFTQGRSQAIWGLVLSGLFGVALVRGTIERARERPLPPGPGRPGQTLTFEELNFRFEAPETPWASFEAKKLNPEATLGFVRQSPQAFFMVVAEQIGTQAELGAEGLAEVARGLISSQASSVRSRREEPRAINGITGYWLELEATLQNREVAYFNWYVVTNGFAYQLIAFCQQRDAARVSPEIESLFARFSQIDPTRQAVTPAGHFAEDFESPRHGYRVAVANSGWSPFDDLEQEFPEAEFGALQVATGFAVVPVWLAGESLEPDALAAGLLSTMDIAYPEERGLRRQELTRANLTGLEFGYEREIDGTDFTYRLQVLQRDGFAYLVAAWVDQNSPDRDARLADALSRIEFTTPPIPLASRDDFTPRERETRAAVLNQAGLFYFKAQDFERARSAFTAAVRSFAHDSQYAVNALTAWSYLQAPAEALRFATTQVTLHPEESELRAYQAYYQWQADLPDDAITNYAGLFAGGYRSDEHFPDYLRLLEESRGPAAALAALDDYQNGGDSAALRLAQARLLTEQGEPLRAVEVLRAERTRSPFDRDVGAALVEALLAADQAAEAREVSQAMVTAGTDAVRAYLLRARSEYALNWYREAKASLEEALKRAPANPEIQEFLDHVSGMLGEGNNSLVKTPIEPVPLPADFALPDDPPAPEYGRPFGAYYLRRATAVAFEPGNDFRITDYLLVHILDGAGVADFSSVQIPFDPLVEELFVNTVRVTNPAGEVLATGTLDACYVLDHVATPIDSQKKVLNVPVPGLAAGCHLEVVYTTRQLGPRDEPGFLELPLSRYLPIRQSALFVAGKPAAVRVQTSLNLSPRATEDGRLWVIENPSVARWESQQPPASEFLPLAWIGDPAAQWPALAKDYLKEIADRLPPEASVRETARRLTAGLDSDQARATHLARFVQTNLTYKAIEFGRRARIPNPPGETLQNRYGDCKDHAVLFRALLESIGVPAHLALVRTGARIQETMPSLDQFDHMVTYLPSLEGGRIVDCTDKGSDLLQALPPSLVECQALILDPEQPRFVEVSSGPVEAVRIISTRKVRIEDLTDATVGETVELAGARAASLRNWLLPLAPSNRDAALQQYLGAGTAGLDRIELEALENPAAPLVIRFDYRAKRRFHGSAEDLRGTVPCLAARALLMPTPMPERLTPLRLVHPVRFESVLEVRAPEGFLGLAEPATVAAADARFAAGQRAATEAGPTMIRRWEFTLPAGRFEPAAYAAYQDTMEHLVGLLEAEVVLQGQPEEAK